MALETTQVTYTVITMINWWTSDPVVYYNTAVIGLKNASISTIVPAQNKSH